MLNLPIKFLNSSLPFISSIARFRDCIYHGNYLLYILAAVMVGFVQNYTVAEGDGMATVCVELISGDLQRDVSLRISSLADGLAQGKHVSEQLMKLTFHCFKIVGIANYL